MKTTSPLQNSAYPRHRLVWGISLTIWVICATLGWTEDVARQSAPGVLLLEGNRVIQGRIKPQGETYAVEQAAGVLIVSRDQVRFVGTDLHSVYIHLQDGLPKKPGADDHLDLARWCLNYKLYSAARFEFQAALDVEPGRDDIRRNLTKLDTLLQRPPREPEKVKPETPAERLAKGTAGYNLDVETLGGLSRDAGREFTRRIQPILMHSCTRSGCHGPRTDNAFKLDLVRQGSIASRSTTEKNLLSLLEYVDRDSPKQSELWKLLKSNHGAAGQSIFIGAKGSEQLKVFQNWIVSLGRETDDPPELTKSKVNSPFAVQHAGHKVEEKPRWRKGDPRATSKADEPPTPEVLVSNHPARKPAQTSGLKRPQPTTKPRTAPLTDVEPIATEERPQEAPELPPEDPFSPDEFNSQQRIKSKIER